jgi:hypothetical protein
MRGCVEGPSRVSARKISKMSSLLSTYSLVFRIIYTSSYRTRRVSGAVVSNPVLPRWSPRTKHTPEYVGGT